MPTDSTDEGSGGVAEPPEPLPVQQSSRTPNNNTSANANNNSSSSNNNNSSANNNDNNNRTAAPPPPAYPCGDVCASCGKKVSEMGGEEAADRPTSDSIRECTCGCHKQDSVVIQMPTVLPQPANTTQTPPGPPTHVPPGGADCLPGCGYSGLPCYNCSLRPDPTPRRPTETSAAFPPQIYTVELQDNMVGSHGSEVTPGQVVRLQSDEDPRAKKRRRTCLSILIAIIAVNVAFQMFKLL